MKVETIIQAIKKDEFSGVVYVEEQNEVIVNQCNGYSDRANKQAITMDTKFAIASGTKLFTAIGIMRLIEEGKLSLEDKALSYIEKKFPSYDQNITIKHLLTHFSGLPDYFDEDEMDGTDFYVAVPWNLLVNPSDYLEVLPHKPMKYKPDETFNYNNSAFILLSIIIEKITGDFYSWIETQVLQKAQMNHSGFYSFDNLPENTALGYKEVSLDSFQTNIYNLPIRGSGDGGMYTTVNDMKLFWKSFTSGEIVSEETYQKMIAPCYESEGLSYGLGVWLEKIDNKYTPLIIGEDVGVSFKSGMNPFTKRIYTIISNTQSGVWPIAKIVSEE